MRGEGRNEWGADFPTALPSCTLLAWSLQIIRLDENSLGEALNVVGYGLWMVTYSKEVLEASPHASIWKMVELRAPVV